MVTYLFLWLWKTPVDYCSHDANFDRIALQLVVTAACCEPELRNNVCLSNITEVERFSFLIIVPNTSFLSLLSSRMVFR